MKISKTDSGLLHSCMYIVKENGHAIIIDPCMDVSCMQDLTVDLLVVTHEHYDHISGVNAWKEICHAPLMCSKACAANIKSSRKNMSRYFDAFCEMQTWIPLEELHIRPVDYSCEADITFEDRTQLEWQGHTITLIEIPGHSAGSIGIDIDGTDFFSGDSLLQDRETEVRFPGGNAQKWDEIGRIRIEAIPAGTRIWPGHFDSFIKEDVPHSKAEDML